MSLLLAGCSGPRDYFPLEVGKQWDYHVRAWSSTSVEEVKVLRRIAVAGTGGFEVGGPLGISRIAWKRGVLVADALPNTRVSPPMPLLVPNDPNTWRVSDNKKDRRQQKAVRVWEGVVETLGKSQQARAELYQEETTLEVASHTYATLKATLRVTTAGKSIEIATWYAEGMGPLRQEQHTNGQEDLALDFLTGPK